MRINHNIAALNTHRQMGINNTNTAKNLEKLSSGFRINRAADDAAGLAISEKMRAQIRGMNQASRNALDGISLVQTAEGSLQTVDNMLVRIKELATQAANGIYNASDRDRLQEELDELAAEMLNILSNNSFNEIQLLDGSAGTINIQIGQVSSQVLSLDSATFDVTAVQTAVAAYDLTSAATAQTAMDGVASQIDVVNAARSYLGANQNRLENTINNLDVTCENLQASESRIRDLDMAKEMMEFTKNNVLIQASTAMLAQANMTTQAVLQLLR